jgi:hypothetical protein
MGGHSANSAAALCSWATTQHRPALLRTYAHQAKVDYFTRADLANALHAAPADVAYWKDDGATAAAALSSEIDQYPYVSLSVHTD